MRNIIIHKLSSRAADRIPEFVDFEIPDSFKIDFAKLIVEECLAIIQRGMDHTEYDDIVLSGVEFKSQKWCRNAIKEHFSNAIKEHFSI